MIYLHLLTLTADTDLRGKIQDGDGKAIVFNAITLGNYAED